MKFQTLPVRRRPVSKGIFHRLSAVTRKRQRVSASATMSGMEMEDGGSKISRALTIIFLIHIVAIALIFIHQRFLDGRPKESTRAVAREVATPAVAGKTSDTPTVPLAANSGKTHVTKDGESYASIAAMHGVAEADLRQLNQDKAMRKGLILSIPVQKVEVDQVVSEAVADGTAQTTDAMVAVDAVTDEGMVDAVPVDVSAAPKAKAIVESESPKASGKTHLVKKGDTIVKIAKQYKVTQDALMSANSITDPTKLKAGANLVIP
ncbi:MAG: LysM peptidoglycan-binding domain-containing protein [Verrucomicrobiota bacterium]